MIRAGPSSSSLPHWVSFSLKPTTHHLRLVWIRTTAGMEASCFHLCNDASTRQAYLSTCSRALSYLKILIRAGSGLSAGRS